MSRHSQLNNSVSSDWLVSDQTMLATLRVCTHSYTHTYIHMHTHIHTYIHTHNTHAHTYMHKHMHTKGVNGDWLLSDETMAATLSVCTHSYIHTCVHTYMHTYIHVYIHTCKYSKYMCSHIYGCRGRWPDSTRRYAIRLAKFSGSTPLGTLSARQASAVLQYSQTVIGTLRLWIIRTVLLCMRCVRTVCALCAHCVCASIGRCVVV